MTETIFWVLTAVTLVAGFVMVFAVLCKMSRVQIHRKVEACKKSARAVEEVQEPLVEPTAKTFEMDQTSMGCSPAEAFIQRRFGWYFAPSLLGNCEKEDFFMRAIRPSYEACRWVGVAWSSIVDQMVYELKAERAGALKNPPFTAIFVQDPRAVLGTIHALKDEGLFRVEEVDGESVVFPTPALVEKVMGTKLVAVAS